MNTKKTSMKIQLIICPCCKEYRDIVKETPLLAVESELHQHDASPFWAMSKGWSIEKANLRRLQWACNACLKSGKAISAKPWIQTFCDHCPRFAYFDMWLGCGDCQCGFIFSAKEQHYWYEVLKFWVQSQPKQCLAYRRIRRERARQERSRQQKQAEMP